MFAIFRLNTNIGIGGMYHFKHYFFSEKQIKTVIQSATLSVAMLVAIAVAKMFAI